jgi:hypothetical protein
MTVVAERPTRVAAEPRSLDVAAEWIEEHCVVPDGFRKGARFRLYDYQLQYLGAFYLVRADAPWVPDAPVLAPAFVYRRGLLVGPQKLGKNPLIAAQICLEAVGPALFAGWASRGDVYSCRDHGCGCGWMYRYEVGEPMGMLWPTPLIQITAFSEDSTENTYDALRPMIEQGPLADLLPKTGEEFIRLPGGGRIDTVTSSNQSRLGQRGTFITQDEVGIWTAQNKMSKVADVQWRNLAGMGGRASMTTNPWDPTENSVAQQQYYSAASDIYRQFMQPPKTLSYTNKQERHRIHRIVYPTDTLRENGGHVDLDAIENDAADLVERDANQAMRFYGNIVVAGAGHAIEDEVWDRQAKPRDVPTGTPIGLGFDGSISRDATVLRGCTTDGYSFLIGAWVRPYDAPEDWHVPRQDVHDKVAEAFATYRVGRFLADPPKWQSEIETWQALYGEDSEGDDIVQALDTNQARKFAPAVDRWRTGLAEGTHTHDDDPITSAHVKAARLKKVRLADAEDDGRTLYVLIKGEDRRQIDGAVADVLAFEAAKTMLAPEPEPEPFVIGGSRW